MSIKKKGQNEIGLDELNIKSHLNTSLELEGISVSEDLINRTLDAIKKEETKIKDDGPLSFVRKHGKLLATVAAAVILLVVGINASKLFTVKKTDDIGNTTKSNEAKSSETAPEYNMAIKEDTEGDQVNFTAANENGEMLKSYTAAGSTEPDNTAETTSDDTGSATDFKFTAVQDIGFKFSEIISIKREDVKSVKITSMATDKTVGLTNQDDIDKLFSLMDNYTFDYGTEELGSEQYIIDLIGEDMDSRITVGETVVQVEYTNKDTASNSIYCASDQNKLIEDLKAYLDE